MPITTSTVPSGFTVISVRSFGAPIEELDVVRHAEAEQLAAFFGLLLARLEAVPVGDGHGEVHVRLVGAAVVEHADRVAVRHLLRLHQILAAQLDAIDAELIGGLVDQPFDREGHLGPPELRYAFVGIVFVNTARERNVAAGMS